MLAYGMKKNLSFCDDYKRNAEARKSKTQAKLTKQLHRMHRHVIKQSLREYIWN